MPDGSNIHAVQAPQEAVTHPDFRDRLLNLVAPLMHMDDMPRARNQMKRILLLVWNNLPVRERRAFLSQVETWGECNFIALAQRWPERKDALLEEAARNWGYVEPTLSGNEIKFWRSFGQAIRQNRKVTDKQAEWAKRIFTDWKKYGDLAPDVVDRED